MIVGIVLGFLADGVYRIVFMAAYGPVIPSHNFEMLLSRGIGLRDTVDLEVLRRALDRALPLDLGPVTVPVATFLVLAGVVWLTWRFLRSRTGRHMAAAGFDARAAREAGLDVERLKRLAIVLSTVIAAIGQVIWVQNIGMLQTYVAHRNVGFLASAALLAGGATVRNAKLRHAIIGTAVFHAMFLLSPLAGQELTGSPAIGEYFRSFVTYGTICIALVLTGINEARARRERLGAVDGATPKPADAEAGRAA
jgi:simple sugar transport system permease protein